MLTLFLLLSFLFSSVLMAFCPVSVLSFYFWCFRCRWIKTSLNCPLYKEGHSVCNIINWSAYTYALVFLYLPLAGMLRGYSICLYLSGRQNRDANVESFGRTKLLTLRALSTVIDTAAWWGRSQTHPECGKCWVKVRWRSIVVVVLLLGRKVTLWFQLSSFIAPTIH